MKAFDKILNILLVVFGCLWLVGQCTKPDKALENSAKEAFQQAAPQSEPGKSMQDAVKQTQKPLMLFVFASWCPHCKAIFPELLTLAEEEKDRFQLALLSTDRKPGALEAFLLEHPVPDGIPVFRSATAPENKSLMQFMEYHKLQFDGGIPYMALFVSGKPVAELVGEIPRENLRAIIRKAYDHKEIESKQFGPVSRETP